MQCYMKSAASTTKEKKFFFLHKNTTNDEKWIYCDNPTYSKA